MKKYLDFGELVEETKNFNQNISTIKALDAGKRESYTKNLTDYLEVLLDQFFQLNEDNHVMSLGKNPGGLFILCVYFEGFVKTALIKEDFDYFFENFDTLQKYENAKNQFLKVLQGNDILNEKQMQRVKDILDYMQVQRNNFLHFPLKQFGHYAVYPEIFAAILEVNKVFGFQLSEPIVDKLKKETDYFYGSAMRFEVVWSEG